MPCCDVVKGSIEDFGTDTIYGAHQIHYLNKADLSEHPDGFSRGGGGESSEGCKTVLFIGASASYRLESN